MINECVPARSVVLMETILRFRRMATLMLFLVSCGAAFLLMPETTSGGVMFLVGARRVVLNSAATALTSAVMGGLVFSLMGFYLISNSVSRDLRSGVGKLIAATPLSSLRYLAAKFTGNMLYLASMVSVFMIACMGMHLVRGEMPLEPWVFMQTFGITFVPSIPCLAAIALMFECVPFFAGRLGDVCYFFFWILTLTLPAALVSASDRNPWILGMDFTGLGFFVNEITRVTGTNNFTIGYAPFNAALSPMVFSGLTWPHELILPRLASALFTIPFFAIAWAAFQRFDPARRSARDKARAGKIARLGQKIGSAWIRVAVPRSGWLIGAPSFVKALLLDVRLTLALSPVFMIVMIGSALAGFFAPLSAMRESIFPIMFFVLVPLLAGVSTRDRQGNTLPLIFSAPFVRMQFAVLKFCSALLTAMVVGFIPLIRLSLDDPFGAAAALNAMLFLASGATLFGVLTRTPKTFVVLALLFLYMSTSSKAIGMLDFAGVHGIATPSIVLTYAATSLIMLLAAAGFERWRMHVGESV